MKKNRDFNLKKIIVPLLIHLLGKEIAHPRLFLLRCRIGFRRFKKSIDKRFPEELIALAAMPLWMYINLKKVLGAEKAFEILRIPVLTAGVAKQNMLFDTVSRGRSFETFIDQELQINKTGTTKWNVLEVIDRSEKRFELIVTKCLYHELTVFLGIPEATRLICQVDNAVFNAYLPEEMIFHREGLNRRIADGCEECHFIWEKKKAESR